MADSSPSPALVAFAKRLSVLRAQAGLTQAELARRASTMAAPGVTVRRDDISRYTGAIHEPTKPKLDAIAAALGVSPDSLFPPDLRARVERPWRASAKTSMEDIGGKTARLQINRVLPTSIALQILRLVEEHAIEDEPEMPGIQEATWEKNGAPTKPIRRAR